MFTLAAAVAADAGAGDTYVVAPGDSIAEIARHHGVEQETLRRVNGLSGADVIHPGDALIIPDELLGGWTRSHRVAAGETLIRIARRHKVAVSVLAKLNRIDIGATLRVGQRIVIPRGKRIDPAASATGQPGSTAAPPSWDGKATFVRVRDSEGKTLTVLDRRGRARPQAVRTISKLARSKKGKVRWLDKRLIELLGKVAERYPRRPIEIVSGFRPHKRGRKRSQHSLGRAMDFRVRGVDNLELYGYLKTLPSVGVGYYPNSTFVHLDVRDRTYLWTDLSGPGEAAIYARAGEPGSAEGAAMEVVAVQAEEGAPDPENFPDGEPEDQPAPRGDGEPEARP
jgi:uncharacterized protein YcbK (DUF882 family)